MHVTDEWRHPTQSAFATFRTQWHQYIVPCDGAPTERAAATGQLMHNNASCSAEADDDDAYDDVM